MIILIHILVQVVMGCALYFLSNHPDLSYRRWWKMAASVPLIFLVTAMMLTKIHSQFYTGPDECTSPSIISNFIFSAVAFILLVLIWRGNLSDRLSKKYVNFFYRDIYSYTGQRPDYKFAYNHRRDGEMEEAIKATEHELLKDPRNFEGLLLLAQIYQDQNKLKEAMEPLQNLLNNPALSESQRASVQNEMANCKRLVDLLTIEEFNKRPT